MLKRMIYTSMCAWAFFAMSARSEIHVEAGGGLFIPAGDSARFNENGYRLGAGLEYGFTPHLAVLLSGSYNRNKVDGDEIKDDRNLPAAFGVDGHARVIELNLSPKLYLRNDGDIGAYLIAGGGPRWLERKVTIDRPAPMTDVVIEKSERSLGMQLGFGVEAAISRSLRLGLTPLYHQVFTKGDSKVRYIALTAYLKL
jgi:opacity protein-like surface antigen